MNKSKVKAFIGILISTALVLWLIYFIDWREVWKHLQNIQYWLLIPYTIVIFLQFLLRSYRWQYLVPDRQSMSLRLSLDGLVIGNFINYILPLRAGEIARPFFLSRFSKNSFAANFAAVVIERFFDLSVVLILFYLSINSLPEVPDWVNQAATALLIIATGILIFIIIACLSRSSTEKLIGLITKILPNFVARPVSQLLHGILEGTTVIKSPKNLLVVVTLSILIWLDTILGYYALLLTFGIDASFFQASIITVIVALAVAAPSAPGFIGVLQTGCIVGFALVGLNKDLATAYSLIAHIHMYLFVIAYGIIVLYRYGIKINDLRQSTNE